jgi:hypothetical protein
MDPLLLGTGVFIGVAAVVTAVANRRAAALARDDLARRRDREAFEARIELVGPGAWRRSEADRVVVVERETYTLARAVVVIVARTPCRAARRAGATVTAWDEHELRQQPGAVVPRDIALGDPALDPLLRIEGDDEQAIVALFSSAPVRAFLQRALHGPSPRAHGLGLHDDGVFVRIVRDTSAGFTDAALAACAARLALELARLLDEREQALPVCLGASSGAATGAGGTPFAIR